MISTVSSGNPGGSLKIRATAPSPQSASGQSGGAAAAKGSGGAGVSENFKAAVRERAERGQKSGQIENSDPAAAQALADSLGQAAAQVKEVYGQESANAFMAKVLSGLEGQSFDYESLTESVGAALKYVAQTGTSSQLADIAETFNRDLAAAEGGPEVKSLSRGLGDFFGLKVEEEKNGLKARGFDARGNWEEIAVEDPESDSHFITGTVEAAVSALEGGGNFSFETVGSEVKDNLTNFLRGQMGAAEAADFLDSAPLEADFMSTLDKTIDLALKENPAGLPALENYLNSEVKGAINASSKLTENPFGQVHFEGWNLSGAAAKNENGEEGERTFSAKWRYLNRDDAVYVRGGQADSGTVAGKDQEAFAAAGAEEELSPAERVKAAVYGPKPAPAGELVNTTA